MNKPLFIHYPKCTTCQRAAAWLKEQGIEVTERHIVEENPTAVELSKWIPLSGYNTAKFFNTSGLRYKALSLKDKVKVLPDNELIAILASEGMLVKRPIVVSDKIVLVGFKPDEWAKALIRNK